ncbi:MAG: hypothetical protein IPI67_35695 [Myxococcales bacterium]|nr:hypothetical protein [Myxococcales bacterium]
MPPHRNRPGPAEPLDVEPGGQFLHSDLWPHPGAAPAAPSNSTIAAPGATLLASYSHAPAEPWARSRNRAILYLDISADTERAGRAVVDRVFDEVGERLAGGKRFLVGERFTAADLTFACMAAALTCPRNYGVPLPTPDELPEPVRALVASYRAHPAGAFALRMFDEHRSRSTGHPQRC